MRRDRLSADKRIYLSAMAEAEDVERVTANAGAEQMGRISGSVAPTRDSLIRKEMIDAVEYGAVGFIVPVFGEYMRRAIFSETDGMSEHQVS